MDSLFSRNSMLYSIIITKDSLEIQIFFSKTFVHIFTEMPTSVMLANQKYSYNSRCNRQLSKGSLLRNVDPHNIKKPKNNNNNTHHSQFQHSEYLRMHGHAVIHRKILFTSQKCFEVTLYWKVFVFVRNIPSLPNTHNTANNVNNSYGIMVVFKYCN